MRFDGNLLVIMTAVTIMVIGMPLVRAWVRRLNADTDQRASALPADLAARLDRLEQLAEATQIEVERLSEGQRFTTKLLSERPPVMERRGDETPRG
jgi:hypothetical protein